MAETLQSDTACAAPAAAVNSVRPELAESQIALLTGGFDRPYAFGLAMALISQGVSLDVVGSDAVDSPEMHSTPGLKFLNLRRNPSATSNHFRRGLEILFYYLRLLRYAATAKPKVFHILWNSKFQLFDRTFLMLYYRMWGKTIVLTAHNVNAGKRDGNDTWLNRLTLRIQYQLTDRIFVHTQKMKDELSAEFGVQGDAVTVMPYPSDNAFPDTELTPAEAKRRLGIGADERTVLFFGSIRPYKGLEYLLEAFAQVAAGPVAGQSADGEQWRLIIAGEPMEPADYVRRIRSMIPERLASERISIIDRMEFVPDAETEIYFKAADVLVLPYTQIFQSGVLFLSYAFGLPVIAADVGSFKEDIVEGKTGMIFRPRDAGDLAKTLQRYFAGDLYRELGARRSEIKEHARMWHSWETAGQITRNVYLEFLDTSGG